MTPAYHRSAAGFMGRLGEPSDSPAEPAPAPQPANGGNITVDAAWGRRVLFWPGFVAGITLARGAITAGRSIHEDFGMLFAEFNTAAAGAPRNHAAGRLLGFAWQLDQTFAAIRIKGIELDFPPIDPRMVDQLEAAAFGA